MGFFFYFKYGLQNNLVFIVLDIYISRIIVSALTIKTNL